MSEEPMPASELIARLKQADEGDHARGCQGREYTCSCGYDELILTAASEAAALLARLREAAPAAAGEVDIDGIITKLYRRFKGWSRRGFGPDDVTWCEVKADILALLAVVPGEVAPAEAEHITPPAGEKIRATQDGEMEAAPVTGQSPVGAVSPAPAEEVGALFERLNNRARQLDNAGDGLGYYSKGDAALDRELAVALSRLQAENAELEFLLNEGGTWEQQLSKAEAAKDAAEQRVADLERITDRLDADLTTSDGHREAAESQLEAAALRERAKDEVLSKIQIIAKHANEYTGKEPSEIRMTALAAIAALAQPTEEAK